MAESKRIHKVKIIADTFISGVPVKAGTVVPNGDYPGVTQQDMKDLIAYHKAEEYTAPAEASAGKGGK